MENLIPEMTVFSPLLPIKKREWAREIWIIEGFATLSWGEGGERESETEREIDCSLPPSISNSIIISFQQTMVLILILLT